MSQADFKKYPTTVDALIDAVTDLEIRMRESAQITDLVLDEVNLRLLFLMQTICITRQLQGGIAGPDGKIPTETKTAYQIYMAVGRDKLLAERQQAKEAYDAASLQAESATPGAGAAVHDDPDPGDVTPYATAPRRTH